MAGKFTVAEVEEVVPNGSLKPEDIHVPGVYVQAIIQTKEEKKIEKLTLSKADDGDSAGKDRKAPNPAALIRERIVRRAALELEVCMTQIMRK